MAHHVIQYLLSTINLPLVLGGSLPIQPTVYTDSSLATGPKSRSISGICVKLHPLAGAIATTSKATIGSRLNTFESELDAATSGFKELAYIRSMFSTISYPINGKAFNLYCDNEAMVNFVRGEGTSKNVRYMDIRLFYTRELYMKQEVIITYMKGTLIPSNLLTKLGNGVQHAAFQIDILGLGLLPTQLYENIIMTGSETINQEDEVQHK